MSTKTAIIVGLVALIVIAAAYFAFKPRPVTALQPLPKKSSTADDIASIIGGVAKGLKYINIGADNGADSDDESADADISGGDNSFLDA